MILKKQVKQWANNVFNSSVIRQLSIKSLTLIGFSLVVLPLTFAFLFGANQVNQLSQQGSAAIINVAKLVKTDRQLTVEMNKMQRFASQFTVLQEQDLYKQFYQQKNKTIQILNNHFVTYQDNKLNQLSNNLVNKISQITLEKIGNEDSAEANKTKLTEVQKKFKQLSAISQKMSFRSNELISDYAQKVKESADNVRTTMLNSLISIPITIIIAGIFVLLIIHPLRELSSQIHRLEQGHFEQKIIFSGSAEIKEIADALELMRARLHALELQKSSFIRHTSHELKTPLAAIREGTELLYDNSVGTLNTAQQEITNILKESVSRLQKLIEDLLDFNIVLDSTSLTGDEKTNLTTIIEQNISQRKLDLQSKQLSVVSELQPLHLQTNAKQLTVVLDNLLSNAIKYSPAQGKIYITTSSDDSHLFITIVDQGPGIDDSCHDKVFDAFYQGLVPNDSSIKSSGLGLTIVKELLMRMKGQIKLVSLKPPNHGLKIILSFPSSLQISLQARLQENIQENHLGKQGT